MQFARETTNVLLEPQGICIPTTLFFAFWNLQKKKDLGRRRETNQHENNLRDVNMDQNSNLKVYKWKFEKEIENVGT